MEKYLKKYLLLFRKYHINVAAMTVTQQEIYQLADRVREIYKTNDGPRLLGEMMREFPDVRRVWDDAKDAWGTPANRTGLRKTR